MVDYYDILGINEEEKKKSENDFSQLCKKKYYELCKKWHPDKFIGKSEEEKKEAETKFKEINEAYQTLTNPQKRQEYDMQRTGPNLNGTGGFNPFDIFRHAHQNIVVKGDDVYVTVDLTFKESYEGARKEIKYKKNVKCHHCNGTGSEDGKEETCPYCNGRGMITETQRNGNMIFQKMHPCQHCHGTGRIFKNPCKQCNGTGFEEEDCLEILNIPPGVFSGAKMDMRGKGSAPMEKGVDGDLIITFNVSVNPYYERADEVTLVHHEKVPFTQALLGCDIEVNVPDGSKIKIKLPELTSDGQEFVQYSKGFPNLINGDTRRGDYIVIIDYIYPKKLTKKQKELLKNFNND